MPVREQKYKLQLCYDFVLESENARSLENLETHSSHFLKMRTAALFQCFCQLDHLGVVKVTSKTHYDDFMTGLMQIP